MEIFQLNPGGRGYTIFMICGSAFFLAIIIAMLWYSVRVVKELSHDPNRRAGWKAAGGSIFTMVFVIFIAVLAGLGGNQGASEGFVTGYSANAKTSRTNMLGICIFGIIVLGALLISTVYFEEPLQLAVSPQQIDFRYRLPWRNWSIPVSKISRVELIRYRDRRNHDRPYYNLVIYYDGTNTRIKGTDMIADRYTEQMKAAYDAIEKQVQSRISVQH